LCGFLKKCDIKKGLSFTCAFLYTIHMFVLEECYVWNDFK